MPDRAESYKRATNQPFIAGAYGVDGTILYYLASKISFILARHLKRMSGSFEAAAIKKLHWRWQGLCL